MPDAGGTASEPATAPHPASVTADVVHTIAVSMNRSRPAGWASAAVRYSA